MSRLFVRMVLPVLLVLAAGQASAFSALYAFGDSLSDTGNVYAATGGATPVAPYYNGRFSNGPIWIDNFAAGLGLSINPSVLGGTNYAFGGAVTGPTLCSAIPNCTTPALYTDLQTQLGMYNAAHASSADPNALYVVWGGGNDVRSLGNPNASGSMVNSVNNIMNIVNTLAVEGARNILVANLPNVGITPDAIAAGPAAQAFLTGLSQSFNTQLAGALPGSTAASLGATIYQMDVYSFLNGVIANPGAYGLTNINTKCFDSSVPSVCATPSQYLFWDGIHPTAAAGAALGQYALSVIPVPGAAWLFVSGLSALGLARRRAA